MSYGVMADEEVVRFNVAVGKLETIALPGLGKLLLEHCFSEGHIYPKEKKWIKCTMEAGTNTEIWRMINDRVKVTWPEAAKMWKQGHTDFRDLKRAVKAVCDLAWLCYVSVPRTRTYFA